LDNTSVAIQNFTELLSLRKVEERFNLEVWHIILSRKTRTQQSVPFC
jgi:hypothetical protein